MTFVKPIHSLGTIGSQYKDKTADYFGHVRREILPLLPTHAPRALEIGCGTGETLAFLKQQGICDWVCGVEISTPAAAQARRRLDLFLEGGVETIALPIEQRSLDLVLCLDVLEHLVDPWAMLRRLTTLLKNSGVLIASIPNIRHYRVLLPLAFRGRWDYLDWGILDRTHLRFFTRQTAMELVASSGLTVNKVLATNPHASSWKYQLLNAASFSVLKPFFEFQYLIAASRDTGVGGRVDRSGYRSNSTGTAER